MSEKIAQSTHNQRGFTYRLSPFGEAFVDFSGSSKYPVLDIGAAFGVASIPALEAGAEVIAVDVDKSHLEKLVENVPNHLKAKVRTIASRFQDLNFPATSLGAVYISQVLPFLKGEEIEDRFQKIHDWLVPGGKLFVVSFTPYIEHVASYIPIYEQKKSQNVEWAGYISDLSQYSFDNDIVKNLPNQINHVDIDDLKRVCLKYDFKIEKLELFGDPHNTLPKGIKYDDRERVGLIARKN
jgi:SAM-dependent methyltransferase